MELAKILETSYSETKFQYLGSGNQRHRSDCCSVFSVAQLISACVLSWYMPKADISHVFLARTKQNAHRSAYSLPMVRYPSSSLSVHNFKNLLRNRLANQSQILCGAPMGRETKVCSRHLGHLGHHINYYDAGPRTKMAAMPIYVKKNLKNLLIRNRWTDFTRNVV